MPTATAKPRTRKAASAPAPTPAPDTLRLHAALHELYAATEARATKRQGSPFVVYVCASCGYKVRATSADPQEGDYADGLAHCGEAMQRQA